MTPSPPIARIGQVQASSPERTGRPGPVAADRRDLLEVGGRLLDRDDPRMLGEPEDRVRVDVGAGPAGHVVDDDRQAALVRDGPEVGLEHPLVGLVVVGRHDERGVGAQLRGTARGRDRGAGVVRAGARDHGDAAAAGPLAGRGTAISMTGRARRGRGSATRRWCRPGRGRRCRPDLPVDEPAEAASSSAPSAVNGVTSAVNAPRRRGTVASGVRARRVMVGLLRVAGGRRRCGREVGAGHSGQALAIAVARTGGVPSSSSTTASNGWRPGPRSSRTSQRQAASAPSA